MSALTDLLFPNPLPSVEELEARYPARSLPQGAKVTRVAPSPTGYMHIGTMYTGLVCERLAHQSGGVFILRIEDTDQKRQIPGATELIASSLDSYGLKIDEGVCPDMRQKGAYGPYIQSQRKEIYQAYVKKLVEEGKAYPCFCTSEDMDALRKQQEASGARPGYHGQWTKCRYLSEEDAIRKVKEGIPYVIRFKSEGDYNRRIVIEDVLRGKRDFPENDLDIVLLKSDGLPTYHFAHVVDDHLMGTNQVIRGDEWVSSLPLHIQLFAAMGWKAPKYGHLAPIQKLDEGAKRKLSKRKDPEAGMSFYDEQGYPKQAVLEYLLNIANSNFEDWRRQNPVKPMNDFPFSLKKMGISGALMDFVKLNSVSRDTISHMTAEEVYENALAWAEKYDEELADLMKNNRDYVLDILNIERNPSGKGRKDIQVWAQLKDELSYFFEDRFQGVPDTLNPEEAAPIARDFLKVYNPSDDKDAWFEKLKEVATQNGYAGSTKEYKEAPEKFKGNISDAATILRLLITGRSQSPDLFAIMRVLGKDRVTARLNRVLS